MYVIIHVRLSRTRHLKTGVVPLSADSCCHPKIMFPTFLNMFFGYRDSWTTFWPFSNFQESHVLSSRIFIPKNHFLSPEMGMSEPKYFNRIFLNTTTKNEHWIFSNLGYCYPLSRNVPWTQKNFIYEMGCPRFWGSTGRFSITDSNSPNCWKFNAQFLS